MSDKEKIEDPDKRRWIERIGGIFRDDERAQLRDSLRTKVGAAVDASFNFLRGDAAVKHYAHYMHKDPDMSGVKRLIRYLETHRHKYRNCEGAQFILALHEKSPETLIGFVARLEEHGYAMEFTDDEQEALDTAKSKTTMVTRLRDLSHRRTIPDMFTRRQLLKHGGVAVAAIGATAVLTSDFMRQLKNSLLDYMGMTENVSEEERSEVIALSEAVAGRNMDAEGQLNVEAFKEELTEEIIQYAQQHGDDKFKVDDAISYAVIGTTAVLIRFGFMFAGNYMADSENKVDQFICEIDEFCDIRMGRKFDSVDPEKMSFAR